MPINKKPPVKPKAKKVNKDKIRKDNFKKRKKIKRIKKTEIKRTNKLIRKMKLQQRKISASAMVVTGLFIFVVLIYIFVNFINFINKPNIPTIQITKGTVDLPQVVSGIIIRDETVYKSTGEGALTYLVGNYEKVQKNEKIAAISQSSETTALESSIKTDSAVFDTMSSRMSTSKYKGDVDRLNNSVKNSVDKAVFGINTTDINGIYSLRSKLTKDINSRNAFILQTSNQGDVINVNGAEAITALLSPNDSIIRNGNGGIVSYNTDGLEDKLTFDNVYDLTKEQTEMTGQKIEFSVNKEVKAGDTLFKIENENHWYIGAYIPENLLFEWEEKQERTIYIQKNGEFVPITAVVDKIKKGDTESYVVFKFTKYLTDFLELRDVSIKTFNSTYEGYKIPATAVMTKTMVKVPKSYIVKTDDGNSYVYKKEGQNYQKIMINVRGQEGDYNYLMQDYGNINQNDTIYQDANGSNPYILSETELSTGIFVVNNGLAEYQKIVPNKDVPLTSEYVILDPKLNTNIKPFDKIVVDSKNIVDKQNIM